MKKLTKEDRNMKTLFLNIILFGVVIGVVSVLVLELIIFGIYKLVEYIRYKKWPYDYGRKE